MSQTPQPQNEETTPNQPNGLWSFLKYAFSFFGEVLKVLQKDTQLAILWGFGVLFLVVIIVAFVLARDIPPLAKVGLVMLIMIILAGLFIYTVPRTDPRKVYPRFMTIKLQFSDPLQPNLQPNDIDFDGGTCQLFIRDERGRLKLQQEFAPRWDYGGWHFVLHEDMEISDSLRLEMTECNGRRWKVKPFAPYEIVAKADPFNQNSGRHV